jgi:hypothetical protein
VSEISCDGDTAVCVNSCDGDTALCENSCDGDTALFENSYDGDTALCENMQPMLEMIFYPVYLSVTTSCRCTD